MIKGIVWLGCSVLMFLPEMGLADTEANWINHFHVGGYVGADLATSAGPGANNEAVSASYKPGWSAGIAAGIRLHERVSTQLELAFTVKGPHSTMGGVDFGTYHIKYLELPIVTKVILPLPGNWQYHALVGPTFGFLLDADIDLADGRHFELDNGTEDFDLGVMLGAGVAVPVGQGGAVTFDVRYNMGLINIDKTAGPVDDDVMNRTVYFLVGYQTDLGFLSGAPANQNAQPVAAPPGKVDALGAPGQRGVTRWSRL